MRSGEPLSPQVILVPYGNDWNVIGPGGNTNEIVIGFDFVDTNAIVLQKLHQIGYGRFPQFPLPADLNSSFLGIFGFVNMGGGKRVLKNCPFTENVLNL